MKLNKLVSTAGMPHEEWLHAASCGVVLSAERAILVNLSGVITEGSAFSISGFNALIVSAMLIPLVSFVF